MAAAVDTFTNKSVVKRAVKEHGVSAIGVAGTDVRDGVVFYRVRVENAALRWEMLVRFNEFSALHDVLQNLFETRVMFHHRLPPFPLRAPKLIVDHLSPHFVRERRVLLANYVKRLLRSKVWQKSRPFLSFLVPGEQALEAHVFPKNIAPEQLVKEPEPKDDDKENKNQSTATRTAAAGGRKRGLLARVDGDEDDDGATGAAAALLERHNGWVDGFDDGPRAAVASGGDRRDDDGDEEREFANVRIPSAQVLRGDHVIYKVAVQGGAESADFNYWIVLKRFSDFVKLDADMRELFAHDERTLATIPTLPVRQAKLLVDHLDPTFTERRRLLLESYLRVLIDLPKVCMCHPLLDFLLV